MTKLRSILNDLHESLALLHEEEEDPNAETTAEDTPEEDPVEEEEEPQEVLPEVQEGVDVVLDHLGREAALKIFGRQLDDLPRRVHEERSSQQLSEELAPYMESYDKLTRSLHESQSATVYRDDYERASALYALGRASGVAYESILDFDANELSEVIAHVYGEDLSDLSEAAFLAPVAAIGRGVVGRIAKGAGTLAAKKLAKKSKK